MTVHVFSTLTASNTYVKYTEGGGDLPVATRSVTIKGGSNLPNKHLVTPIGILAGTYLAEYGRHQKLSSVVRFINDILLSAPSIVVVTRVWSCRPRTLMATPGFCAAPATETPETPENRS